MVQELAPRPKSNAKLARVAYDVLMTMDNTWLNAEEIIGLMSKDAKRGWNKKKLRRSVMMALANGTGRGTFIWRKGEGDRLREYQIASKVHHAATYARYVKRAASTRTTKKSAPSPQASRNTGGKLVAEIDRKIEECEATLDRLYRMRKDAEEIL